MMIMGIEYKDNKDNNHRNTIDVLTMSNQNCTLLSRRSLEERAKRIVDYYLRVNKDKKRVIDHFAEEGVCKRTVNKVIKKHEEKGDVSFIKPPGRKAAICTPEMFDKVANLFKQNPELPSGEAAKQLGIARTTIFRILAKMRQNNIETYKTVETRCPTCHQKCDPKVLMKKEKVPKRPKKTKESTMPTTTTTTTHEDDNNTDEIGYQQNQTITEVVSGGVDGDARDNNNKDSTT